MWKPVPNPVEAWEYLHAGLLWHGYPERKDMTFYPERAIHRWTEAGLDHWIEKVRESSIFRPNYILLED